MIICNEYTDEGNLGAAGVIVAREGGMYPVITNGELLFNLNKSDGGWEATHELWTGSGEYAICLQISGAEGWDDDHPPGGGYHRRYWWTRNGAVVKYNIKDALTTIPFSEFEMEW